MSMGKMKCTLELDYETNQQAQHIFSSTQIDDETFVQAKVKQNQIHATISSETVSSLLHTLDDYLSCVSVAEKIIVDKN